jgi:glycosyltransferase involved in cell wall biosynthesis
MSLSITHPPLSPAKTAAGPLRLVDLPASPPGATGWPWTLGSASCPLRQDNGDRWPKVGVVIPNFNQGTFLEKAIRSALLQGYPALELIIVDGGSTDDSIDVIKRYQSHLAYWVSERDDGQAHAINKGWQKATAPILTWLNSDDYFLPAGIQATVRRLYSSTSPCDFAFADCALVDSDGLPLGLYVASDPDLETMIRDWTNPLPQQGFLVRSNVLKEIGMLDTSLSFAMDVDLWMRALLYNKTFGITKAQVAAFRLARNTKTGSQHSIYVANMVEIVSRIAQLSSDPRVRKACKESLSRRYLNAARNAYALGVRGVAASYARQDLRHRGWKAFETMGVAAQCALPSRVQRLVRFLELGVRRRGRDLAQHWRSFVSKN